MYKFIITVALVCVYTSAAGHTALVTSNPADGAVINKSPEQLQMIFTADVALVKLSVTDSEGKALMLDFTPSSESKDEYLMAMPQLANGHYKVDWAVIGADGHTVANSFSFAMDSTAAGHHGEDHHGEDHHGEEHHGEEHHGEEQQGEHAH
ncbi:MAG: copper resistance protein CopC [Gammaproteobacteria bacterium]|nr:copper resistance protein CopC [Gammaproteobacteria bacterium]